MKILAHKQIALNHPSTRMIEVDSLLAGIMERLWKIGIATKMSCEGPDEDCGHIFRGFSWIVFKDDNYARWFLEIMTGNENKNLIQWRITRNLILPHKYNKLPACFGETFINIPLQDILWVEKQLDLYLDGANVKKEHSLLSST